ncbi:predicted protein [Sclerotinia sclerotiorum 1980 UF-70]|uniref:Uncharacterized protein n=1 Tax=Sclerotinia sclerotiorum (strain ATCC 18683 / 1980 / Ss-1) TaxID=665079 RepID=A7E4E4_SCLS1|nr:predicted protein [Sclerotinia sclerotiorum 1980 UF-70]EDN90766.1 predicted protein [Sclerotinia sclerotiorum 1980 UF-70]
MGMIVKEAGLEDKNESSKLITDVSSILIVLSQSIFSIIYAWQYQ